MLTSVLQRMRKGRRYEGPAAWCDDYTLVPKPGYYALTPDGKHIRPDVPLVCVDDAPGDVNDGSCHFEYAGPRDYPQRSAGRSVKRGDIVSLEVEAEGKAGVEA